jgi:hypothetical protein
LTFSAHASACSGGDGIELVFSVDDFAFTLGPARPGFMEIVGQASAGNGEILQATLGGIQFNAPPPPETVPIVLGTPMPVTVRMWLPAWYADGPTFSEGIAELIITGVRDASGNPVPIFAASQVPEPQVPEPNEFAALGVTLLIGALATRRRRT